MSGSEEVRKQRRLVIGIDAASDTGLCIVDADTKEVLQIGRFVCKDAVPGKRYNMFIKGFLESVMKLLDLGMDDDSTFAAIGIEMPHHRGRAATEYAYGYLAMTEWLADHPAFDGAPVVRVHSSTLKKYATGNGRATKEEVVEAANEILFNEGFEKITNDNIADALFVALLAAERIKKEERAEAMS